MALIKMTAGNKHTFLVLLVHSKDCNVDRRDSRDRRETRARLVSWDHPEYKAPPDYLASLASKVFPACRVMLDRRAERETRGRLGLTARTELMESLD